MVVVGAGRSDFASLELSFDSDKPGCSIFGPKFSKAKSNIANTGSGGSGDSGVFRYHVDEKQKGRKCWS